MEYKVPLVMTPQPEGGYTVTSPVLPELVTEGDTLSDALHNAKDALAAVIELYEEDGRPLPRNIRNEAARTGSRPAQVSRRAFDKDQFNQRAGKPSPRIGGSQG